MDGSKNSRMPCVVCKRWVDPDASYWRARMEENPRDPRELSQVWMRYCAVCHYAKLLCDELFIAKIEEQDDYTRDEIDKLAEAVRQVLHQAHAMRLSKRVDTDGTPP